MTNEMPTMPENNDNSLPGESDKSGLPGGTPSDTSGLPGEKEVKQSYITPETDLDSVIKVPVVPKKGIDVIATRAGFFGQQRISLGQKFVVKNFEQLGLWMKCEDKDLERKRVKSLEDKKRKAKR